MPSGRRVATRSRARASRNRGAPSEEEGVDPAFHRAILKIAIELKKANAPSYEEIVSATIRSLGLDPAGFRRYLGENGARNMSLLLAAARGFGP